VIIKNELQTDVLMWWVSEKCFVESQYAHVFLVLIFGNLGFTNLRVELSFGKILLYFISLWSAYGMRSDVCV
jgi:hypothetical protein